MNHFFLFAITTKPHKFLFLIIFSHFFDFSSSLVHIRGNSFNTPVIDAPARFAVRVNRTGICGALYVADPLDACSPLRNSNKSDDSEGVRFALIERGKCAFEVKVRNAQERGFITAIVYDNQDKRNLVSMVGNSKGIFAHAVFVSKVAGETLKKLARGEEGECCISASLEEAAAWTVLVISFISLLVIIAVLGTFFFTRSRQVQRQGTNHHSLSIDRQLVRVLPCFKFNSACQMSRHLGETCAICLEDYREGETLKVLPCQHEFHTSCVDSWLTKWGTFCPVCKHEMGGKDSTAARLASEQATLL